MSRKEVLEKADKYKDEEDEDALREMNEYEKDLMKQFEENDAEIDNMLDNVIQVAEKIHLYAQDINTAIMTQAELLKKVNNKAEKARQNLVQRNSAM